MAMIDPALIANASRTARSDREVTLARQEQLRGASLINDAREISLDEAKKNIESGLTEAQRQQGIEEALLGKNKAEVESIVTGAIEISPFVDTNDYNKVLDVLNRRLEEKRAGGRSDNDLQETIGTINTVEDILANESAAGADPQAQAFVQAQKDQFKQQLDGGINAGRKVLGGQANAQFGSGTKVRVKTNQDRSVFGVMEMVRDPVTGTTRRQFVPFESLREGEQAIDVEVVGADGLTGGDRIQLQTEAAEERKRTGEQIVTEEQRIRQAQEAEEGRQQVAINEAIEISDAMPELRRAIALLDDVGTGGFEGAKLRAKRFFGIEAGDEGELASSLITAVLARLKETFGAQFTEREGALLIRASANPSASTETNRRLLERQEKLWQRKIDRGRQVAEQKDDKLALEVFSSNEEFSLDPETQTQTPQFKVGDKVENPDGTYELQQTANGLQWVLIDG